MTKLDFINFFIKMGISVMPLYHRSKEPILSTWREFQTRLPNNTEYLSWFPTDWNNYAVIAGWNNLVVIDFDNMDYYNIWRLTMSSTQYVLSGLQVRTRKGVHVYLTTETPCANDKRISTSRGIDIQAQGKYVVGPGCTHPSGHVYGPIGELIFPVVRDIESVLPLDLFPRVRADEVVYNGDPIALNNTEYLDPFAFASMDLISKVKSMARVEDFYPQRMKSSVNGQWYKALCPFHDDHKYSAWVDVQRQLAGCQVCGMKSMDAVNLYARMHNMTESVAVRAMAEELGVWR